MHMANGLRHPPFIGKDPTRVTPLSPVDFISVISVSFSFVQPIYIPVLCPSCPYTIRCDRLVEWLSLLTSPTITESPLAWQCTARPTLHAQHLLIICAPLPLQVVVA